MLTRSSWRTCRVNLKERDGFVIAPFTVRRSAAPTGVQKLIRHSLKHSIVRLLPLDCLALMRVDSASGERVCGTQNYAAK